MEPPPAAGFPSVSVVPRVDRRHEVSSVLTVGQAYELNTQHLLTGPA